MHRHKALFYAQYKLNRSYCLESCVFTLECVGWPLHQLHSMRLYQFSYKEKSLTRIEIMNTER